MVSWRMTATNATLGGPTESCDRRHNAKGLCDTYNPRLPKNGDPETLRGSATDRYGGMRSLEMSLGADNVRRETAAKVASRLARSAIVGAIPRADAAKRRLTEAVAG